MKMMKLTNAILNDRVMFKIVTPQSFEAKHHFRYFPGILLHDQPNLRSIFACPRSKNGNDFSVSDGMLKVLLKAIEEGFINQAYVALVDRDSDGNFILINYTTLKEQWKLLKNFPTRAGAPGNGRYPNGPFHWVDQFHNCIPPRSMEAPF